MAKKETGIERRLGPVRFMLERETKNKIRYQEVDASDKPVDQANEVVGTIYVSKSKIGKVFPSKMTATLVFED